MRQLVLIRHDDAPPDDRVAQWAQAQGIATRVVRPCLGEATGLPGPDVLGSVIYGGPFNVFEEDRHPFLHDETAWIRESLARGLPTLGICQGGQQIARTLGAWVGPPASGVHEFGMYEVTPTDEGRAEGFLSRPLPMTLSHWHHFDVPEGAVRLAGSALYPNQAFRYGSSTYALQFHPECTPAIFRRWQDRPTAPWGRPGVQDRATQDALIATHDAAQGAWFEAFLDRLFRAE